MKTVLANKKQWEEENWLRIVYLADKTNALTNKLVNQFVIALNVLIYINYKLLKGLWLIFNLLVFSKNNIQKIERDETWIFRQIK